MEIIGIYFIKTLKKNNSYEVFNMLTYSSYILKGKKPITEKEIEKRLCINDN